MPIDRHPAIHDPGVQVHPHQPDHASIFDTPLEPVGQDVVVDPVKEPGQVHVHHHALGGGGEAGGGSCTEAELVAVTTAFKGFIAKASAEA